MLVPARLGLRKYPQTAGARILPLSGLSTPFTQLRFEAVHEPLRGLRFFAAFRFGRRNVGDRRRISLTLARRQRVE
jgi:hypothetical protein